MKLINLYVKRFDVQYLKVQKFLNPYPSELALEVILRHINNETNFMV